MWRRAPATAPAPDACGVGLQLETGGRHDDVVVVAGCLVGSPAHRSGEIRSGDVLEIVNGVSVAGLALWRVREAILGQPGTTVRLHLRRGSGGLREVVLARQASSLRAAPWAMDASAWSDAAESVGDSALHKNDLVCAAFGQEPFDSTIWASVGNDPTKRARRQPLQEGGSGGGNLNPAWRGNAPADCAEASRLSGFKGAIDRESTAGSADNEDGFDKSSASMRESGGVGGWEWVSRYAIGTDDSRLQENDPFLPSLSVTPERSLLASRGEGGGGGAGRHGADITAHPAEAASQQGNESLYHDKFHGRPSSAHRPPLHSYCPQSHEPCGESRGQGLQDNKSCEGLYSGHTRSRPEESESDLQRSEELHARLAVLDHENTRLKHRIDELEAVCRSVEEAEEDARRAKQVTSTSETLRKKKIEKMRSEFYTIAVQANREMDERLLGQVERIHELKRQLAHAREHERVLEEKERMLNKLQQEVAATAMLQVSDAKGGLCCCGALFEGLEATARERERERQTEKEGENRRQQELEEERRKTLEQERVHRQELVRCQQEIEAEKARARDAHAELCRRKAHDDSAEAGDE